MNLFRKSLLAIFCIGCSLICCAQQSIADCKSEIRSAENFLNSFRADSAFQKFQSAMQMATNMHHDSLYAVALFGAGQARWYKSDFKEAASMVLKAQILFQQINDRYNTGTSLRILSNIYDDEGDYENAFATIRQALVLYQTYDDPDNEVLSLVQIGTLFKNIKDYETAMGFYANAVSKNPPVGEYPYRELQHRLGELYMARGKIDSARYFYNRALNGNPKSKIIRLRLGESFLIQNNAEKALNYIYPLYEEAKESDVMTSIASSLDLAKIYMLKRDATSALPMAMESLTISAQRGQRQGKRDAYEVLSNIYESKNDAKNALLYQKLFQNLKDSLLSDQFKAQLFSFKQQAAESAEILSLQSAKRMIWRSLFFVIVAAILILGLVLLRQKNEKLKLRQKASELEMQALRAQMNPHFIFNCLTAINHFILKNENDKATEYLTRFSRLLRTVLINAGKETITLEEELTMLRLYLTMEQLRFKEAFDYRIDILPTLRSSEVIVPSFLLQPFCENAIWHGLLHKEEKGTLWICCFVKDDIVVCTIEDDGIGRKNAANYKKRSDENGPAFGQKLSAERLILFNRNTVQDSFVIEDLEPGNEKATGTRVILKIKQPQHD